MTGEFSFSDLFFTDVLVPAGALLGPLHRGWEVAMTTLSHERAGVARFHTSCSAASSMRCWPSPRRAARSGIAATASGSHICGARSPACAGRPSGR
jgi:hypothetical protein